MYQEARQNLHTIRDYLRWAASRFDEAGLYFGHGTDNAWDEAVSLISQILHLPNGEDAIILDARLTESEQNRLLTALKQRLDERLPLPYITGQAWFCELPFTVDKRVLIPRSPIAELIRNNFKPWLNQPPTRVLDMCCGSACIGIAIGAYLPNVQVDCSDISSDALAVAQQNITRHDCQNWVQLRQSDGWEAFADDDVYDLIVVNPPYVNANDLATMPAEYRHEPQLALAAGTDGLDFCRQFFKQAAAHLQETGLLILEVGNSGQALEAQYPELNFTWLELEHGGVGVLLMDYSQAVRAQLVFGG